MTKPTKEDPRQAPAQLNVSISWSFRQFLTHQARTEGISLAQLVKRVLMAEYGTAYTHEETKHYGATK